MNTVRKLKTSELSMLTELFKYKDVNDMIAENTRDIENGIIDIFALFDDDNARARYMYEKNGFTEPIARIKENYQGDSYEYDLLLKR